MHHIPGGSDLQLLELARKGDQSAFEVLYRRYDARVYGYLWRMVRDEALAADLRQETFLRLWENIDRATSQRSLPAYLIRIARNLAIDHDRYTSVRERWAAVARSAPPSSSPSVEVVLRQERIAAEVNGAIDALPERMREVFILKRDAGLSYSEISDSLGISPKTVERHISNALQRLRKALAHLVSETSRSGASSGT